nr:SusC/RagA family TonB-linked outer membrane protein [uncultured Draconibacterium sp.]
MKLTVFLLLVSVAGVFANKSYSQTKMLNLKLQQASVKEVLANIEEQSEFYFLYSENLIDAKRKVDVNIENKKIEDALNLIFEGTDVDYSIRDRIIVLTTPEVLSGELQVGQQQNHISGNVTDETGEPLVGVTVVEKGTTHGTVTDINGQYSINDLSSDAVLVFSFVGMETVEVTVRNQTEINVTLKSDAVGLDEVVVTALGIKREQKALGYSVQQVEGESLQKVTGLDVGTSLTGKVAGVLVQNSTEFGAEPQISIRGEGNPLIVIDGVAYANKRLNDIAAVDIESMSVLKGATASALYGFRGESGAILITTKNGSSGNLGVTVDVTSNTMFNAGFLAIPERQSVYGRGINGNYDKNQRSAWGPVMDGTIREQWDPIAMEYREYEHLPIGKDNFKNFLETGYITTNGVNVGFRTDKVALRSSLNWTKQKGVYPNSKLDKFTYSVGGDINLDRFKLSTNMSYSKRYSPNLSTNGFKSYDVMYSLLIYTGVDYNILDYKDNYWMIKDQKQNFTYQGSVNNPYFDRYEKTNESSRDIFNADLTSSYEITDWLKVTARSGIDFFIDRGTIRLAQGSYNSTGDTGVPGINYPWNGTRVGAYITGRTQGYSLNNDILLTGDRKFIDDRFVIDYLAGGTIYYSRNDNLSAQTTGGISIPGYYSLKASVNSARVGESTREQQANSVYGRVALSWDNFIFVEVTGRNDWVSMLANANIPKSDRSYFYPAVGTSFIVSELLPESTDDWLNLLKVRGSWTQAKTSPSPYAINRVFGINTGIWLDMNGATAPHSIYSDTYNPNDFATKEVGIQGILFNKRLTFDISYFNKRIYNQLVSAPRTPASGVSSVYLNSGEERARKGAEVVLGVTPVKKQDLQVDLTFNWGTYKEIYTKIDEVNTANNDRDWVAEGKRTDFMTIQDWEYQPGTGEIIWENGLPKRSNIYTFYGYRTPDWQWGSSANVRYKDFSLFMSFDGVVGGLMNTVTESYMWQNGMHPESVTETRALDVATGEPHYIGEGVKVVSGEATFDVSGNVLTDTREFAPNDVAVTYENAIKRLHGSSAWGGSARPADIYEKTFFKLREISLTYTVPKHILQNWKFVKGASVSFVGQNVLFWAKDFKYSDPDGGNENFADPSGRYLGGNLKFTF